MIWYATNKMQKKKKEAESDASPHFICNLENKFVWVDSIGQWECGAQISLELRNLLDQRKQKRIHCFLVRLALLRQLVLLQRQNNKNIRTLSCGHRQSLHPESTGTDGVLPPSLCRRFLPPGAWVSSSSSSWSRSRPVYWGTWRRRCPVWCWWRCRTSGELYAGALGSEPEDLRERRDGHQLFTPSNCTIKAAH